MFENCSRKTNSPLLRHIIAKLFYKIILRSSDFATKRQLQDYNYGATIAGLQEHGGVRGEALFSSNDKVI
jgi:hypothetical protein